MAILALAAAAVFGAAAVQAQVTATGTMGPTNPPQATLGTAVNQTSMARLLSLNSVNDFCVFGPSEPGEEIGNIEERVVAWCVQPRNNARVIPDGTITSAHFVKTPLYWQVQGQGDFTKIDIKSGDAGGELDPHGATGEGNPVGGNVTTNATGTDVHYEEWMNYMSYNQFCLRICISQNATYSAAIQCQHTLDVMGCQWVMPGDYTDNSFTECDGDSAYPPGLYPQPDGSTSTFAQRYTGTFTQGGSIGYFTVGQTVTPQTPYSVPATSNCRTFTSIGNGIASLAGSASSRPSGSVSGSGSASAASASVTGSGASSRIGGASASAGAGSSSGAQSAGGAAASGSSSRSAALAGYNGANYGPAIAGALSVVALAAGAGAILL